MTRHFPRLLFPAIILTLWGSEPCFAQLGYNRPATSGASRATTSPYLNLNRRGNQALNYYNLVRPEFEFRNATQNLQGQLTQQEQAVRQLGQEGIPVTGHSTRFVNYSHFYGGRGGSTTQGQSQAGRTPQAGRAGPQASAPRGGGRR